MRASCSHRILSALFRIQTSIGAIEYCDLLLNLADIIPCQIVRQLLLEQFIGQLLIVRHLFLFEYDMVLERLLLRFLSNIHFCQHSSRISQLTGHIPVLVLEAQECIALLSSVQLKLSFLIRQATFIHVYCLLVELILHLVGLKSSVKIC